MPEHAPFSSEPALLLDWLEESRQHEEACILWSSGIDDERGTWLGLAGFGAETVYTRLSEIPVQGLHLGWTSYEFKNALHGLQSRCKPAFEWPECWFMKPRFWQGLDRAGRIHGDWQPHSLGSISPLRAQLGDWSSSANPERYEQTVSRIRRHIVDGDFYELNYCVSFEASAELDPQALFAQLVQVSPAPFACFVKKGNLYLLSSSPERFLQKREAKLLSQPIKGTRRRQSMDDEQVVAELERAEKDRAENIMIVDLVRNDLSRVCLPGTVQVDELCRVYSFEHVHQMISTVSGTLQEGMSLEDIWRASFPMGSMTGAPKRTVMEQIDRYEGFARGLYSGSVGWFHDGNFDFNVVIRALQFDQDKGLLGYHVGGAITFDSDPKAEYQECLDKAAGLRSTLGI